MSMNFLSSDADENIELLLWSMIDTPVDQSATTSWTTNSSSVSEPYLGSDALEPIGLNPFSSLEKEHQCIQLQQRNEELQKKNEELQKRNDLLVERLLATPIILPTTAQPLPMTAQPLSTLPLSTLPLPLSTLPLSTIPLSTIPSYRLQKANYPQVKFWTKKDWLESDERKAASGSRGKGRLSKGINVGMRYVETAEGLIVDGFKASEMRSFARSIWLSFTELCIAPLKWGQCTIQIRQFYCREMGNQFPELLLCELDWKADQIATKLYSGWYKKWLERQQDSEVQSESDSDPLAEESESDVPPATGPADGKRSRVDSMAPTTKRSRQDLPSVPLSESVVIPSLPGFAPFAPNSILPNFSHNMTGAQFTIPVDPRSHSEVAGPSTVTKQTDGKMRVGSTTTPRNLCAIDWCKKNPHGMRSSFKRYYDNISSEELKNYETLSIKLSQEKLSGK